MSKRRASFFKRAAFTAWAMLTLVLAFCVVLLVYEMVQQGQNPLAISNEPIPQETLKPAAEEEKTELREVALYFADQDARSLVPENREIPASRYTVDTCRAVLEELIAGPQGQLTPILPPSTQVYAMYLLEDGELVVDFSIDLVSRQKRSAAAEALMTFGVANTLTQAAVQGAGDGSVRAVRFLVEGAAPDKSLSGQQHLDLSAPIEPDSRWLAAQAPAMNSDG